MTSSVPRGWQEIQTEILSRIHSRKWKPGEYIPNETELATEFGCARATINRALQAVADQGWLDRRRRAGTRVNEHPVRKATLTISIIREEIQNKGQAYSYKLINARTRTPPSDVLERMDLPEGTEALYLQSVHFADETPLIFESRWINSSVLPGISEVDFSVTNANEWLVRSTPFTTGDFIFSATAADKIQARYLNVEVGVPLFHLERTTWSEDHCITFVRLAYAPGYELRTQIS